MWSYAIVLSICNIAVAMFIPEDTEILDGYKLEQSSAVYPDDEFFELRSLSDPNLIHPIRDKRNSRYIILESHGLKSHFKSNINEIQEESIKDSSIPLHETLNANKYMQHIAYNKLHPPNSEPPRDWLTFSKIRNTRSLDNIHDVDTVEEITSQKPINAEILPVAEKQIRNNYMTLSNSRSPSDAMERWTKAPSEYSKVQDEEDSMAEASLNEGIKARTPRVNFVTQQKKNTETNENADQNPSATKPEIYRYVPEKLDDRYYARQYPSSSRYQDSEAYSRRYDDRDMIHLYQPEYSRSLDYMPRTPAYPDYYYDYPDRRYDVPDSRRSRPMYTNDINDRYPSEMTPPRNRRIIYYATLPDIVRTPPSVDLRYRSYNNNRYNNDYHPYVGGLNNPYIDVPLSYMPSMEAIKSERNSKPLKRDNPTRISSALTVKDAPPKAKNIPTYMNRPIETRNPYY